jgi:hypothetical protein
MRSLGIKFGLGAVLCVMGIGSAYALPINTRLASVSGSPLLSRVQWDCNQDGCFDQRTGAFTASGCDRRGCYPTSGVKGRMTERGPAYYDPRDVPQAFRGYDRYDDDDGYRRVQRYSRPRPRYYEQY